MRAQLVGLGWVTTGGLGTARAAAPFAFVPGPLARVARKAVFAEPDQRFGRLDDFSRLGLAGVTFALRDAGLEAWTAKRPIALVAATEHGCLLTDADYFDTVIPDDGLTSPNLFAYTLPSCFLGEAAIRFGLTGPSFVVTDADPAGLTPLRLGLELLDWGEADTVVAGICNLAGPFPGGLESQVAPGAVFAVLSTTGAGARYGELTQAADGSLHLAGAPVASFAALVAAARAAAAPAGAADAG